eukprot:Skav221871  [mRNA]  locus=scaffold1395:166154:170268:+ [translate_table: standard]
MMANECLFRSEGMLKEELEEIQEVQGDCATLQKRSNGWLHCSGRATGHVMGLEALADFLGEAGRAAIETADAEERASAVGLLQDCQGSKLEPEMETHRIKRNGQKCLGMLGKDSHKIGYG